MEHLSRNTQVEIRMLRSMLLFYCRKHHGSRTGVCSDCSKLLEYTCAKVRACPYRREKPSCRKCPRYCFEKSYREAVKKVMISSGWKVLLFHPVLTYSYYKRLTDI